MLPTYMSFDLLPGAGDAEVYAYDDQGTEIFYEFVPGATSFVSIVIEDVGPIAEVLIIGGDNETWLDDICID
jgi:hypothetical protein